MDSDKEKDKEKAPIPAVSIADWLITLLILFIPVLNVIMLLVWSFNKSTHRSKANFSKAVFILLLTTILLVALILAISGVTFFDFMGKNADFIENPF